MVGKANLGVHVCYSSSENWKPFLSVCAHRGPKASVWSVPSLCLRVCLLDYVTHFLRNLEWFPRVFHMHMTDREIYMSPPILTLLRPCVHLGTLFPFSTWLWLNFCLWSTWNVPFNTFPRQLYYSQFRKSFPGGWHCLFSLLLDLFHTLPKMIFSKQADSHPAHMLVRTSAFGCFDSVHRYI